MSAAQKRKQQQQRCHACRCHSNTVRSLHLRETTRKTRSTCLSLPLRASPRCCTQLCGQRPRTHPRQSGGLGANRTLHPRALHEARQRHLAGSCHGYRGQLAACPHAAPLGHHTPFFTLSRRSVGSRRGSTACPCCKAPPVRQQRASSRHRSGRKDAARSHRDAPAPGCREPDRAQMASTQRPAPSCARPPETP